MRLILMFQGEFLVAGHDLHCERDVMAYRA
jgi:hypothetical protein